MNILGVYNGHDAHFCLLQDGQLIHHYSTERFVREKHAAGWRQHVLDKMFSDAEVSWQDIDAVAIGGGSWVNVGPSPLYNALAAARDKFRGSGIAQGFKSEPRRVEPRYVGLEVTHEKHTVKVYHVDHHLAHAAQAYYTSPFTDAVAVTSDGGGDNAFTLTAHGEGNKLSSLEYGTQLSIGNIWTWIVVHLYQGLSLDGEGKIMGHAAYGSPREDFCGSIERMMRSGWGNRTLIDKELAYARSKVNFGDYHAQSTKDYSASLQHVTEKLTAQLVDKAVDRTGVRNVALSGGCAYNCVANGKLALRYPNMFVSNCPHDGGLGVGAALFVWHHVMDHAFEGVAQFSPFRGSAVPEAPEATAPQVVDDLLDGKLVAWCDGRAENGNRALGHRSILADPRDKTIRDRLNDNVKQREWYRPFAPSVLEGHDYWGYDPVPKSWYMSFSARAWPGWAREHPGVVHVDKTTRPHVVTRTAAPTYWRILDLFHQATGCPMVLNTSFNVQEPIVETEEDARATFARSDLDVLYVGGERVTK